MSCSHSICTMSLEPIVLLKSFWIIYYIDTASTLNTKAKAYISMKADVYGPKTHFILHHFHVIAIISFIINYTFPTSHISPFRLTPTLLEVVRDGANSRVQRIVVQAFVPGRESTYSYGINAIIVCTL